MGTAPLNGQPPHGFFMLNLWCWRRAGRDRLKTPDPQIRKRLVLYPAELPAPLQEKGGPPEEIRTPDPQICSLIIFNSLTFLHFP